MSAHRDGLLLFAHGARDPNWARPFEAVLARVRAQRPEAEMRLAFLELMTPDLAAAAAELAAAGCGRIAIVPLFLGAGGHVRKDLPALVARLGETHPAVAFELLPPVGEAAAVIEALAQVSIDLAFPATRGSGTVAP
jgi:sirohydrochlorin cobaltochelatase